MIFIRYEPGVKGYQFWDAAHWHLELPHDVKFEETQFSVKEMKLTQSTLAPLSVHQFSESNSLGLDLVNLTQPPTRSPIPGLSALGPPVTLSQYAGPQSPPLAPPQAPQGSFAPIPDMGTAPSQPSTPQYSFHPTEKH